MFVLFTINAEGRSPCKTLLGLAEYKICGVIMEIQKWDF